MGEEEKTVNRTGTWGFFFKQIQRISGGTMKRLLPSLKEKKRYLVLKVIWLEDKSNKNAFGSTVLGNITESIKSVLGVFDSASAGIMPVEYNAKKGKAILKVNKNYVDKVKSSLLFISKVEGQKAILKSEGVSGILKVAREKFV